MTRPDRYGESVDLDAPASRPHDPRCRHGWLGDDSEGRPIPCLTCRPHLRQRATVNDHGGR